MGHFADGLKGKKEKHRVMWLKWAGRFNWNGLGPTWRSTSMLRRQDLNKLHCKNEKYCSFKNMAGMLHFSMLSSNSWSTWLRNEAEVVWGGVCAPAALPSGRNTSAKRLAPEALPQALWNRKLWSLAHVDVGSTWLATRPFQNRKYF